MNITKKGETVTLEGTQPKVGDQAPDFTLANLTDEKVQLSSLKGQTVLISVVPDIDTRVCSIQTKRFNQEAGKMATAKFITISNNTKEEQENWCAAEGVDMEMLHDTDNEFGSLYGLRISETGRLARAIFILNPEGKLIYEEIVPELSQEPDYTRALEMLKK